MILAAHQPGYLPWLGYFDKIARADCFIVADHVQYEKQNFQNRNRFKLYEGVRWLTVPLVRGGLGERICDKRIAEDEGGPSDWRRRTWRTLELAYGKARYFDRYAGALAAVYERRWERLIDLDLHLLGLCLAWLEIETPLVRSSALEVSGQKTDLILELCERFDADVYLSGSGASRSYLDVAALAARGVEVVWQRFEHPVYPQLHEAQGFVPQLSVLDLLFNCGPASRKTLLGLRPGRAPSCEAYV